MKKLLMTITFATLALNAFASGGSRGSDAGKLALKNSQAGFVYESIEHSMRLLHRSTPSYKDLVVAASAEILSADNAQVIVTLTDGTELNYSCIRFDDWSRSGTVLKKEVVCRNN